MSIDLLRLLSVALVATALCGATPTAAQQQLGSRITGTFFFEQSAQHVALSADGSRVAVPGINTTNAAGEMQAGRVRVFDFDGSSWNQVGSTIEGKTTLEILGSSVAMSDDGTRLVIGGSGFPNRPTSGGVVRVYDFVNGDWQQTGTDLVGGTGDLFGEHVAISGDGNRIAAGSIEGASVSQGAGYVKAYTLVAGNWQQLGSTIVGENPGDRFGTSIDMNASGVFMVVGAPGNDDGGVDAGSVRAYSYINNWKVEGGDIDGDAAGDLSGTDVAIAASNFAYVVGAPGANGGDGRVRVYQLQGSVWNVLGSDFDGAAGSGEGLGDAVDIAVDYTRVVMGATLHDEGIFVDAGSAGVYDYNLASNSWSQVGTNVVGGDYFEYFGTSVGLSADGSRFAIGANNFVGNLGLNRTGAATVYDVITILPVELASFTASAAENGVNLAWTTASERGNAGFDVERSGDGEAWASIGFVGAASADGDVGSTYTFSDAHPLSGVNYYRLRQRDLDGGEQLSGMVSVVTGAASGSLTAYPNPTTDRVQLAGVAEDAVVTVVDVTGRTVWSGPLAGGSLSLKQLGAGLYVVRVGDQQVRVMRK